MLFVIASDPSDVGSESGTRGPRRRPKWTPFAAKLRTATEAELRAAVEADWPELRP